MVPESATQEELKGLFKSFIQGQKIDESKIRFPILSSWKRCRTNHIDHCQKASPIVFTEAALARHQAKHAELMAVSMPIMEKIYVFLKDGGFVVALFDASGILLKVIGDLTVKEETATVNFVEGASWAEDASGTNAVGTAIIENQPLQVFGREHYFLRSSFWTCSAAPIHDADGNIIGVLDITGSSEKVHSHTLGMAVMAVNDIESQLRLHRIFRTHELSDNYKNTIIDSISEGLLAIDEKGTVTHINDMAAASLGHLKKDVIHKNLWQTLPARKNQKLHELFKNRECVTDYELTIFNKKKKINCLHTSRPIMIEDKSVGTVMLFSEIERARRLIVRMSGREARFCFADLIGRDPKFIEIVEMAKEASGSRSNILITGESGSGKDVLAQAIHNASGKRGGPFIAINCSSIPRELIASELFGYVEGAFTGASRGGKPGKFELADRGTLFLDEIGDMPLDLQTSLLRVLETKTISRLGDNAVIPIAVRIIAATNKDLYTEVLHRNFRQDLFYRLNVIALHMIPLRERKGDIPCFVKYFLKHLAESHGKEHIVDIEPKVMRILKNYYWPGNVRELQNVIERSLNVCTGKVITTEYLPEEFQSVVTAPAYKPTDDYERQLIRRLLEQNNSNMTNIARQMGIARVTLYRKIAKYGLIKVRPYF